MSATLTSFSDAVSGKSSYQCEVMLANQTTWTHATQGMSLPPGSQIRTGFKTTALLTFDDGSTLKMYQLTTMQIQVPEPPRSRLLEFKIGSMYFFNRDQPGESTYRLPQASAGIRG